MLLAITSISPTIKLCAPLARSSFAADLSHAHTKPSSLTFSPVDRFALSSDTALRQTLFKIWKIKISAISFLRVADGSKTAWNHARTALLISLNAVERSDVRVRAVPTYAGISNYYWKTEGGPLVRFHFKLMFISTRLAILTKRMPLFIP